MFSLAIPFDEDGPQTGQIPGRENPRRRMLAVNAAYTDDPAGFCASDDALTMGVQAATHWDALAHVSYEGRLYNGTDAAVIDEAGAGQLGIEHFGPVVTRGVLADVARLHGVDHLDGGYAISGDDLDAALGARGRDGRAGRCPAGADRPDAPPPRRDTAGAMAGMRRACPPGRSSGCTSTTSRR